MLMDYTANDNLEVMKFAKHYNQFLTNSVFSVICKNNGKNILDFGCADGYFMQHLFKRNSSLNYVRHRDRYSLFEKM